MWRVAFSPDGKYLVSQSTDDVLKIWDVLAKQLRKELKSHCDYRGSPLSFSPSGAWLYHQDDKGRPTITDSKTLRQASQLSYKELLEDIAFSNNDKLLATAGGDWTVRLWDTATGQPFGQPMRLNGRADAVCFSPNSRLLATASLDNTVRFWNTATQSPVGEPLCAGGKFRRLAFDKKGEYIASCGGETTMLWRIDDTSSATEPTPAKDQRASATSRISPDGRYRAELTDNGEVKLERNEANDVALAFLDWKSVLCVAFSPDCKLLATGAENWRICIWEVPTGRLLKVIPAPERVYGVAFSPSNSMLLATAQQDGTARLWNVGSGQEIGLPMQHDAPVWEVAFDPKGEILATSSGDDRQRAQSIRLWDVTTEPPYPDIVLPFRPLESEPNNWSFASTFCTFDIDGQMLVRGVDDDVARKWRLPAAPSDPYFIRNRTWLALCMRRTMQGTSEALGSDEWQKLKEELNATSKDESLSK